MCNFIKGVQPPKRKLSADVKVVHKRRYDACERKREFQPHWLKQFSWLEHKSSSAGAGVAAHAAAGVGGAADRRDDDADRRDDDADRRDDEPDRRDDDADRRDDDANRCDDDADRRDYDADRHDDDVDRRDDDPGRLDDDADRRDDDAVVDVEGGESDGTAKNTETELNMIMFCKYCCKYEKAGSFVVGSPVFKL